MHYCEERFLEVARRFGVLGMPARHVSLEEAFKAHASQARAESCAPLQHSIACNLLLLQHRLCLLIACVLGPRS